MTFVRSKYEDILVPRRLELSNLFWASRTLHIKYPITIKPRPTPESHKNAVLASTKITQLINELCQKRNAKKEVIIKELRQILDEIGYKKNLKIIRWLGFALTKICMKVCSGIYVNYHGIDELKKKMGFCPVIYVPSHRSYADFILFSYVCFTYDLEIPAIAAAMDFHGMMGMGEMLRNTGAFYINRSANNDPVYWSVFKEYINQLVTKGDEPIEFFIEGTRSRSNKSLTPKYGLILMILKALFLGHVSDILFVPVSINYDRILEESLFGFELLGIPKPKESTSGFLKSLRIIKEKFGNMYVHFDTPISARDFFGSHLNHAGHRFGPDHSYELTNEEKALVPPLAFEIVRKQQTNNVLNSFNLFALLLNNNLTQGKSRQRKEQLIMETETVKHVLLAWGAKIFDEDIQKALEECLVVHANLICENNGEIVLVQNQTTVGPLNASKLKAHALSEQTISYSVPFIMLQLYVNPILHYLIDAALILIILKSFGDMSKDALYKHFIVLRSMFSVEFVTSEQLYQENFEKAFIKLSEQRLITTGECGIIGNNLLEEVLINSIQPFILTYFVVIDLLLKSPSNLTEKALQSSVQKIFEDAILERKIFIHPYCMSLDTLSNCIYSFASKNLLQKKRQEGQNIYQVNYEKLSKLKEDLEIYIPSFHVIKSFDMFLHLKSKI
ncbi:dihydroxyacetone phosphate acyltransferase [Rhynchophorus ferrugineus]|uniref:dihydroxyacetone phosphate acyltransferase n=1 Tax=Rhynchophorus ferrugineus TaxID=354439 RepID=UPI003FCED21B